MSVSRYVGKHLFRDPFFMRPFDVNPSSLFRDFERLLNVGPSTFAVGKRAGVWQPSCDVSETEREYRIVANMPGVKKENISVSLRDESTLEIAGNIENVVEERSPEVAVTPATGTSDAAASTGPTAAETSGAEARSGGRAVEKSRSPQTWHYVERTEGSFKRLFELPVNVDREAIVAKYENGVLNVTVPKLPEQAPEAKARTIAIQ